MEQGRFAESLAESQWALKIDPFSLVMNVHLGEHYLISRQYDQAIEQCQKVLDMDANFALAHYWLGESYERKRMYDKAIPALRNAITLAGASSTMMEAGLAHTYAISGNRREALKILGQLTEQSKKRYVSAVDVAVILVGLGETNEAFGWLARAYEERATYILALKTDPRFDGIRSDPRSQDLLRRLGLLP